MEKQSFSSSPSGPVPADGQKEPDLTGSEGLQYLFVHRPSPAFGPSPSPHPWGVYQPGDQQGRKGSFAPVKKSPPRSPLKGRAPSQSRSKASGLGVVHKTKFNEKGFRGQGPPRDSFAVRVYGGEAPSRASPRPFKKWESFAFLPPPKHLGHTPACGGGGPPP